MHTKRSRTSTAALLNMKASAKLWCDVDFHEQTNVFGTVLLHRWWEPMTLLPLLRTFARHNSKAITLKLYGIGICFCQSQKMVDFCISNIQSKIRELGWVHISSQSQIRSSIFHQSSSNRICRVIHCRGWSKVKICGYAFFSIFYQLYSVLYS